jgi:hypothetical protein
VTEDFENEDEDGDEELSIGWEAGSNTSECNCVQQQYDLYNNNRQQGARPSNEVGSAPLQLDTASHGSVSATVAPALGGAEIFAARAAATGPRAHLSSHSHSLPTSLVPLPTLPATHLAATTTAAQLPPLQGWGQSTADSQATATVGVGSSGAGGSHPPHPHPPTRSTRLNAMFRPQGLDPELLRQLHQGAAAATHLAAAGSFTGAPGYGHSGQEALLQGAPASTPGSGIAADADSRRSSVDAPEHSNSFSMPIATIPHRPDVGLQRAPVAPVAPSDVVPFTFPSLLQPAAPHTAGGVGVHTGPPRRASSSGLMVPQPGLTYLYNTAPTFPVSGLSPAASPAHHPLSPELLAQHEGQGPGRDGAGPSDPGREGEWRRTLSGCSGYSTDISTGAFAGSPLHAVVRAEGWLEALAGSLEGVDPFHDHVVQQISLIRLHYAGVCLSGCV